MTSVPVPKIYWEAFQSALNAQVKRLARDIASSVKQPEQPLLKALASEKITAHLFEEEGQEFQDIQSMRCQHPRPSYENPSILQICNEPILIGKGNSCPFHTHKTKLNIDHLPVYRKIRVDNSIYLLDSEDRLYSFEDFKMCGFYKENKCTLFQCEETT